MAYRGTFVTAALAVAALAAGAAADTDAWACSPLGDGQHCVLPFPDDFFLSTTWNATAPRRMQYQNGTFPVDNNGAGVDPTAWNARQGSPVFPQITAVLPGLNLDLSGAPRLWNISSSTTPTAVSLLLNTVSGEAQLHWMELDYSSNTAAPDPVLRATLLWPAAALEYDTRYIVAYRNLVDDNGAPVVPSDGFAALRDNRSTSNPAVEASRARFEAIFATLQAQGWSRESLTLAWDFTTTTKTDVTGRFVSMRDDAFQRVGNGSGIVYGIDFIDDNYSTDIYRRIRGHLQVSGC